MRNFVLFCASLFTMVLLMSATPVRAQLWVSPTGSDSNACTEISPCLTFQGAVNKGSVSQINCLSSGSYGTVSITTSLTIDCGTGNSVVLWRLSQHNGETIGVSVRDGRASDRSARLA